MSNSNLIKNDVSIMASISRITLNNPITIPPMFLAGEFFHKIEVVFCWV
jgi:hypothetical protein